MAAQDASLREALRTNEDELKGLRRGGPENAGAALRKIEIDLVRKQAELKYLDETSRKELGWSVEELSAADIPSRMATPSPRPNNRPTRWRNRIKVSAR